MEVYLGWIILLRTKDWTAPAGIGYFTGNFHPHLDICTLQSTACKTMVFNTRQEARNALKGRFINVWSLKNLRPIVCKARVMVEWKL